MDYGWQCRHPSTPCRREELEFLLFQLQGDANVLPGSFLKDDSMLEEVASIPWHEEIEHCINFMTYKKSIYFPRLNS